MLTQLFYVLSFCLIRSELKTLVFPADWTKSLSNNKSWPHDTKQKILCVQSQKNKTYVPLSYFGASFERRCSVKKKFVGQIWVKINLIFCGPDCDKTQNKTTLKLWLNSYYDKAQIVTKLKLWKNSNCDKTQIVAKRKLLQNSYCNKTWILTKLRFWRKINLWRKLKLWQNGKCDQTQNVTKLKRWQVS